MRARLRHALLERATVRDNDPVAPDALEDGAVFAVVRGGGALLLAFLAGLDGEEDAEEREEEGEELHGGGCCWWVVGWLVGFEGIG